MPRSRPRTRPESVDNCLVFGASGAIGRFLVTRLLAAGERVFAVSRCVQSDARTNLRWIEGSLESDFALPDAVETIFSCGPLDAFARWYERTPTGAARVVAIGSMSADSKRDSIDAAERDVASRLAEAEARVLRVAASRGAAATLLRPTLVYGAGRDRSLAPIARFARRWRVFPRIVGANGLRQPVHADDLAIACVAASSSPRAAGRHYEVGGGERLTFSAMIERTCRSLDVSCLALPVPLFALRMFASSRSAAVVRLTRDLVADNADAARDFGWSPRLFAPDASRWPRDA